MARKRNRETDAELFARLKSWFSEAMARQAQNRYQMQIDCMYYDSIQHTPDELAVLRRRGQPVVVYNEVKPTIDWLIGTERRMRRDFRIVSRSDDSPGARADAEIKTALMKYLSDVGRLPFERSRAVDDMLKAGVGWLEIGVHPDPEDGDEPIYFQAVPWTDVIYDDMARRLDGDDDRFRFRFREVDLDWALGVFGDAPIKDIETKLRRAAESFNDGTPMSDWLNGYPTVANQVDQVLPGQHLQYDATAWLRNARKRLLLIECWHREYWSGKREMHVSIMTEHDLLLTQQSPYRHGKFPFVPYWCYRRKIDGAPYGPIRAIRGPQDSLNKRMSKALFAMSTRQIRAEESAIDDGTMPLEDLREEAASPDGILIFANGALSGGKVQFPDAHDVAMGHLSLAERDALAIRQGSGIVGEARGLQTNATSGKAIIAKQEQGSMVTAEIFDNMLLAEQIAGEITLSLIEQFVTAPKVFSVLGERKALDFHRINQVDEQTGEIVNDVTRIRCNYIIGDAPWRQSLAESAFESMMQMLGQLGAVAPNVVLNMLDLVFEWSQLPGKDEIVRRIRAINGQSDPDQGDTPEQQQAKAQQQALAAAQMQAQMASLDADVSEAKARGEKLGAEAVRTRLTAIYEAAQAAQVAATVPQVLPIADQLLKSAGFQDQDGGDQVAVPPQQPIQAEPLPELQQADGIGRGIETPVNDGIL